MNNQLWYLAPLILSISLVYGATRHELMFPIFMHAYRLALWTVSFMAAIFFAVLEIRQPIEYAKWSFGSQGRDQAKVTQGVETVTEGSDNSPRVSFVIKLTIATGATIS